MTIKDLETQYASLGAATGTAFIKSIHAAKNDPAVTPLGLIGFLDRIIGDFRPEGKRICQAAPDIPAQDRETLTLYGRIVAAAVIISHGSRSVSATRDKTLLFIEYASALVRTKYDFVQTAMEVLSYPVTVTGLDWKTVEDAPSLDIISYKLIAGIKFDRTRADYFLFTGKGKVVCNKGVLSVYSAEVGEAGARAFSLYDGKVEVVSRNTRGEKLKSTDQGDVEAVGEFASSFIKAQEAFEKGKTRKREYVSGDVVDIQLVTRNDTFCGRILDLDDPVEGPIEEEELMRGTETGDVFPYLCEEDVIRGAVLLVDEDGRKSFSIRDAYEAYAKERARQDERDGTVFEARVTHVRKTLNRINWMTPHGYGGISYPIEGKDLKPGDTLVMTIYNIQTRNGSTYINLCEPKYGYDMVDERFDSEEAVLADFVTTADDVLDTRETLTEAERSGDADTVGTLASVISNRAACEDSLDACKALLTALFLRTAVGDAAEAERLKAEAYYLGMCVAYAQGVKVPSTHPYHFEGARAAVLGLLSRSDSLDGTLLKSVSSLPDDSLERKIGDLLVGLWVSSEYCDQVKADPEDVRKKVCGLLGVADQFRNVSGVKAGKYGKAESHDVEFKSSYVFRNDAQGADLDLQGRDEIFRTVCGFLNADGGTLYLGVNDAGEPITAQEYGINADIRWLCANYQTVNLLRSRQLGHPVYKADTLDHYVLFLNGEKQLFFRESLLGNIKIEVTEDADAIRISVSPAEYEIAYLFKDGEHSDGTAYVRDGGRTVEMSPVQKERRLASLKRISKEMGFIVTIQEAIDQHRKLVFKDYASGNSGKVTDRFVVPINLFYNHENVYCYDLKARKNKQFRLRRISSIETEFDNPYYPLPKAAPKHADVFRWLDEGKSYHVKLKMAVGAKNYLLEEYSCAEKLPPEELYMEGKETWILDTRVYGLDAVRRFYLGLADKIEILETEDSEALKADIAAYASKYILDKD